MPVSTEHSGNVTLQKTAAKTAAAFPMGDPQPPEAGAGGGALVSWVPTDGPNARAVVSQVGVELVGRLSAQAHNLDTIAAALGISRRSLGRAFDAQPDLKEAFDAGRGRLEQELAALLLEKARAGNVTCAIFLLKAQCGWRDAGSTDGRAPTVAVQINLPAAMSEAAYAKFIEEKPSGEAD
jgi:hypothetical protein